MLILAHRGFHRSERENTLPAFDRAAEIRVDGIETDVRLSADGKLVLFHDRLAGKRFPVSELSHAELCQAVGFKVPTLGEAIDRHPDELWNLEVKVAEAVPKLIDFLKPILHYHRFFLTSFLHKSIRDLSSVLDVDCGFLIAHDPIGAEILKYDDIFEWRSNSIIFDFEAVELSTIDRLRELKIRPWAYNIGSDTPVDIAEKYGFYGIVTDDVEHFKNQDVACAAPLRKTA